MLENRDFSSDGDRCVVELPMIMPTGFEHNLKLEQLPEITDDPICKPLIDEKTRQWRFSQLKYLGLFIYNAAVLEYLFRELIFQSKETLVINWME